MLIAAMRALPVMVFCLGVIADIGKVYMPDAMELLLLNSVMIFRGKHNGFLTLKAFSLFKYRHGKLFVCFCL